MIGGLGINFPGSLEPSLGRKVTIRKEPIDALYCQFGRCTHAPAWRLAEPNGTEIGRYCDAHADSMAASLNRYAELIGGSSSSAERD